MGRGRATAPDRLAQSVGQHLRSKARDSGQSNPAIPARQTACNLHSAHDLSLCVPTGEEGSEAATEGLPAAVGCQLCGGTQATLPHLNCANIDCARLFVACNACKVLGWSCIAA